MTFGIARLHIAADRLQPGVAVVAGLIEMLMGRLVQRRKVEDGEATKTVLDVGRPAEIEPANREGTSAVRSWSASINSVLGGGRLGRLVGGTG